jgi:DHA1 family tetracycline resistance protein-like MFS transporter
MGERGAAALGISVVALGFIAYSMATQGWMVFVILAFTALQSLVMPSLSGLMSRCVPANAQGELQGFNGSVSSIAAIIAPLVLNPALAWFTSDAAPFRFAGIAFVLAAAAAIVALVILLVSARNERRAGTLPPPTGH